MGEIKTSYQKLLESEKWNLKRKQILKRDSYKCRLCRSVDNLQVHHLKYYKDRNPADYPNTLLITLCEKCHLKQHKTDSIVLNSLKLWHFINRIKNFFL